jgi:hypothetical protein
MANLRRVAAASRGIGDPPASGSIAVSASCSTVGLRLSSELPSSRNEDCDYGPRCAENQPTQGLTWPMLGSIDYEERYERYVSDGQRAYQIRQPR